MAGNRAPIIVKRVKKIEGGHHGGAWKVAYADFVTAMMAFFLLMWLLNATTEEQRKGLADYFDPSLPISRTSAGGTGMLGGETIFSDETAAGAAATAERLRYSEAPGENPAVGTAAISRAGRRPGPHDAPLGRAEDLAEALEAAFAESGAADATLRLRATPEGLAIELLEGAGVPLFAPGSAVPSPLLRRLIAAIVPILSRTATPLALVGHTDSTPFGRPDYGNWELSTDRAQAARRLLNAAGFPPARIARVGGRAATAPIGDDPSAPENRRISLILLRTGL